MDRNAWNKFEATSFSLQAEKGTIPPLRLAPMNPSFPTLVRPSSPPCSTFQRLILPSNSPLAANLRLPSLEPIESRNVPPASSIPPFIATLDLSDSASSLHGIQHSIERDIADKTSTTLETTELGGLQMVSHPQRSTFSMSPPSTSLLVHRHLSSPALPSLGPPSYPRLERSNISATDSSSLALAPPPKFELSRQNPHSTFEQSPIPGRYPPFQWNQKTDDQRPTSPPSMPLDTYSPPSSLLNEQLNSSTPSSMELSIATNAVPAPARGLKFVPLERPSTHLFSTLASSSTPSILNLLKRISSPPENLDEVPEDRAVDTQVSALAAGGSSASPLGSPHLDGNHIEYMEVDELEAESFTGPKAGSAGVDPSVALEETSQTVCKFEIQVLGENDETPRVQELEPPRLDTSSPLSGALSTVNHLLDLTASHGTALPSVEEEADCEDIQMSEEYEAEKSTHEMSQSGNLEISLPNPLNSSSSTRGNRISILSGPIPIEEMHIESFLRAAATEPFRFYSATLKALAMGIACGRYGSLPYFQPVLSSSMVLHWDSGSQHNPPQDQMRLESCHRPLQLATLDSVEVVNEQDDDYEHALGPTRVEEPDTFETRMAHSCETENVVEGRFGDPFISKQIESGEFPLSQRISALAQRHSVPSVQHEHQSYTFSGPSISASAPISRWNPDDSMSESMTFDHNLDASQSEGSDSQCLTEEFRGQRPSFRSQVYSWLGNPVPETCPVGVQFLASLVTSVSPPLKLGPLPFSTRVPVHQNIDTLTIPNPKKRRITLHPMAIEAPPTKLSKR